MGSSSSTVAKDQRVAISGDAYQVTAPQSQIANPFGLAFGASENANVSANVTISGVKYNDLDQVNQLVSSIMTQNNQVLKTNADLLLAVNEQNAAALEMLTEENARTLSVLGEQQQDLLDQITGSLSAVGSSFSNLGEDILDSISTTATEIKEPLSKYIPMIAIIAFIFVLIKMGNK